MSVLMIGQIIVNLILFFGFYVFWVRLKRPPQDDPRLSRGLQLLQSKISVLEDLSDRTDTQVEQLNRLIEKKTLMVQKKIEEADGFLRKIQDATRKSLEVAQIFQDKIPHEEIIERKNKVKYIKAAQLAHQGMGVEQISQEVDLPESEVELIIKFNKDQLMFDEAQLPTWAWNQQMSENSKDTDEDIWEVKPPQFSEEKTVHAVNDDVSRLISSEHHSDESLDVSAPPDRNDFLASSLNSNTDNYESLKRLGDEFRQACQVYEENFKKDQQRIENIQKTPENLKSVAKEVQQTALNVGTKMTEGASHLAANAMKVTEKLIQSHKKSSSQPKQKVIKRVEFPRI